MLLFFFFFLVKFLTINNIFLGNSEQKYRIFVQLNFSQEAFLHIKVNIVFLKVNYL